jgi:hypothetical protein
MFRVMTSPENHHLLTGIAAANCLMVICKIGRPHGHWPDHSLVPIREREMVKFIEIAAPMLIVAYAAMYLTMRYFFPPEVRR